MPLSTRPSFFIFFFFNDTATTEIYTLSLHDALPISISGSAARSLQRQPSVRLEGSSSRLMPPPSLHSLRARAGGRARARRDRKSTRLNSSHANISYAVFCLKKKNKI